MAKVKPRCFAKAVTTAGTAEQLTSASIKAPAVFIQAEVSNTGQVYFGDSSVSSSNAGGELDSGDSITLSASDLGWAGKLIALDEVWLDVSVSTDGVWVTYLQEA